MTESRNLAELVNDRIDEFLESRASILAHLGDDLLPFSAFSREFLSGGKRFRASFSYWGWQSVRSAAGDVGQPTSDELRAVVTLAASLEIFHAAALVHDDIIDNSDTRRGAPAAHRRFEKLHTDGGWDGDGDDYGRASAILLGDLLLGWSDEILDEALALVDRATSIRVRAEFMRMRTEVTAGQYLDILEERAWRSRPESEHRERAQRVVVFKSAKYSIEAPLALGALLAGGSDAQLETLRSFGLPLGVAFQLRDDLLGVFGDEKVTGKPSGDDLREGKRTVLIALTREAVPAPTKNLIDELLGDPTLEPEQIASLQATITESGAVDRSEEIIAENVRVARAALDGAPLGAEAVERLSELAETVTRRNY